MGPLKRASYRFKTQRQLREIYLFKQPNGSFSAIIGQYTIYGLLRLLGKMDQIRNGQYRISTPAQLLVLL